MKKVGWWNYFLVFLPSVGIGILALIAGLLKQPVDDFILAAFLGGSLLSSLMGIGFLPKVLGDSPKALRIVLPLLSLVLTAAFIFLYVGPLGYWGKLLAKMTGTASSNIWPVMASVSLAFGPVLTGLILLLLNFAYARDNASDVVFFYLILGLSWLAGVFLFYLAVFFAFIYWVRHPHRPQKRTLPEGSKPEVEPAPFQGHDKNYTAPSDYSYDSDSDSDSEEKPILTIDGKEVEEIGFGRYKECGGCDVYTQIGYGDEVVKEGDDGESS